MSYLYESLTEQIIGYCIDIHKALGPGLLENTYKQCLAYELNKANIEFQIEVECPVIYKNIQVSCGYRIDLLVDNKIIIELKSVEKLMAIHDVQILTYLKLKNKRIGLLINFNEKLLSNGIKRFIL